MRRRKRVLRVVSDGSTESNDMATIVTYNGVQLNNVTTRAWDEEIVYDPSETEVARHKFRLTFEGLIHIQGERDTLTPWVDKVGGSNSSDVGALAKLIRRRLAQARKQLVITAVQPAVGEGDNIETARNIELFRCEAQGGGRTVDVDVDNGPKPRDISVTHVINDKLLRVRFTIECSKLECVTAGTLPAVLNHRWSVTEEMDENFFITQRVRGRIRLSTSLTPPLSYKGMVVKRLEEGFKRKSITFVASENGLEAEYEVVDRQVHTAAPWPATSISGTYTESSNDGLTWFSEVNVRLEGHPGSSRIQLIQLAFQVVDAKMNYQERVDDVSKSGSYPVLFSITEHIGEVNAVDCLCRLRYLGSEESTDEAAGKGDPILNIKGLGRLGVDLELPDAPGGEEYGVTRSTAPSPYGYNPTGENTSIRAPDFLLFHLLPQDPCAGVTPPTFVSPGETGGDDEETEVTGRQIAGDLPESESDLLDDAAAEAIYLHYKLESRYIHNRVRVQLPIADPDINEATDSTSALATLAPGQARREIRLEAERVGKSPEIPEPVDSYTDGSLTGVLLKHWDAHHAPTLSPDARRAVYRSEAYYLYALMRPPTKDETTRIGVLPFTKFTQADTAIKRSDLYATRLAP